MPSIQASLSRSSQPSGHRVLLCGPLEVRVSGDEGPLLGLIDETLSLFDVTWTLGPLVAVEVRAAISMPVGTPASGRYIEAARMRVDPAPDGLRATTDGGTTLVGHLSEHGQRWHMTVPPALVESRRWFEVEDLLTLILTTGWRRAGWAPVHAAGLVSPNAEPGNNRGLLICAGSGGGKTTLAVAMVRRGWRSLGDDKLLLATRGTQRTVASIKQMLNIDPAAAAWFPELSGIASQPAYSTWTPKRRVSLGRVWPHAPTSTMVPTHLVVVSRSAGRGGIMVSRLDRASSISALLHQTVIPNDPSVARPITSAVARVAEDLRAFRFELFEDAFSDPQALERALAALT